MEQKIFDRLKKYETNYKYILSNNKIYPMLSSRDRREITLLYNTIFARDVKVLNGCVSCGGYTELVLRELAKYYFANIDTTNAPATEATGSIETLSAVPSASEIEARGDKDGQTVVCDENYALHNDCTPTPPVVMKRSHHKKK